MTIFWFETPEIEIDSIPHSDQFQVWKRRLSKEELGGIRGEFDRLIVRREANGNKILTSNWLPSEYEGGSEWSGTPFWPIYESACRQNWQHAGWFFGLLLWEYMMTRDDAWICGKFDKDGIPIGGTTYFEKTS